MSIQIIINELIHNIKIEPGSNLDLAVNFTIHGSGETEKFNVFAKGVELGKENMHSDTAIALIEAREKTIQAILDLGIDPVQLLMKFTIPSTTEDFKVTGIDQTVFIDTGSPDGHPIQFKIFTESDKIILIEGESKDFDIGIKIKPSFLPKLIEGDVNLAMALLTGKIKISNKRELFQLLTNFGLKF